MKQNVTEHDFIDAFRAYDRMGNFSCDGLRALYDYMIDLEEGTEEWELDVVALCCDFAQYENLAEFHQEFDKEDYPDFDSIQDNTTLIMVDDESFIVGNL